LFQRKASRGKRDMLRLTKRKRRRGDPEVRPGVGEKEQVRKKEGGKTFSGKKLTFKKYFMGVGKRGPESAEETSIDEPG